MIQNHTLGLERLGTECHLYLATAARLRIYNSLNTLPVCLTAIGRTYQLLSKLPPIFLLCSPWLGSLQLIRWHSPEAWQTFRWHSWVWFGLFTVGALANLPGPCGQVRADAKGTGSRRCQMPRTKPSQYWGESFPVSFLCFYSSWIILLICRSERLWRGLRARASPSPSSKK